MQHLLNFKSWTPQQITKIIDIAIDAKNNPKKWRNTLDGKTLCMIFQKTSTRTRVSFEVAMTQLGGHAIFLDWRATNFAIADIQDETRYLSRNVDVIMARLMKHADMKAMAEAATVPTINGCDDKYHPCQALADLMTIKEKKGKLAGVKLVYVGVHNNVCNSLIEACTKTGMRITTVTPIKHPPAHDPELIEDAKKTGLYETTLDVKKALKEADIVYTDTWVDMELFTDPKFKEEKEKRIKQMMPYQINAQLLKGSSALVMHDMPIHRGYEISPEIINAPNSIIFDQAENRLHSEKAILLTLLNKI
ncbi:MAG: ornithine carbamoyltransferase [Candidatus Bathyarchaeia archaeon]|jgi:ornithine carbamoyltransferase|nr:ornithine carbamoyltransferase [Candidatus Bathyarchaeota archaeon A05DMB-4]MDH7595361.1 ornithine carbamoyltransferase [Candidatus Bathyarchaeota archaeon]